VRHRVVTAQLGYWRCIRTRRGRGKYQLGKCDADQAGAKQRKTGNGHSEETLGSEFFTHGTPRLIVRPRLEQNDRHFAQSKGFRAVPKIET
jgi:hypothetical protein